MRKSQGCCRRKPVCFCQPVQVFLINLFLRVCNLQKSLVQIIYVVPVEFVSKFMKAVSKCAAPAPCGEYYFATIGTHFIGIDDFICKRVFEKSILVDTGRM